MVLESNHHQIDHQLILGTEMYCFKGWASLKKVSYGILISGQLFQREFQLGTAHIGLKVKSKEGGEKLEVFFHSANGTRDPGDQINGMKI